MFIDRSAPVLDHLFRVRPLSTSAPRLIALTHHTTIAYTRGRASTRGGGVPVVRGMAGTEYSYD